MVVIGVEVNEGMAMAAIANYINVEPGMKKAESDIKTRKVLQRIKGNLVMLVSPLQILKSM